MPSQIRAVLFDLDGVIVRTDHLHYRAWKELADEQGWRFDETVNHQLRGVSRLDSLRLILAHNGIELDPASQQRHATSKNERYVQLLHEELGPDALIPGIIALLDALAARGVALACCSSSRNAQLVLDSLGLSDRFTAIVTGADVERSKPAPDLFLEGARRLRLPPFHCLVLEDARAGVQAALAAGMKVLGIGSQDELPEAPEQVEHLLDIDVDWLLTAARPQRPPCEPWAIVEDRLRPARSGYWETVFALSNGRLGLRGAHEEDDPALRDTAYRGFFVNGIVGYEPYRHLWSFPGFPEHGHGMLNLADWIGVDGQVDGARLHPSAAVPGSYQRRLDLLRGVLHKRYDWIAPGGQRLQVRSERLVSLADRRLAGLRYRVVAESPVRLHISAGVQAVVASQSLGADTTAIEQLALRDDGCDLELRSRTSDQRVALALRQRCTAGAGAHPRRRAEHIGQAWTCELAAGEELVLEKIVAVGSSIEQPEPDRLATCAAAADAAAEAGFDSLLAAQTQAWAQRWALADVEIDGAESDQQALRFNLFHMIQAHPHDQRRSIGANCLTGDKYRGHVFWDTEMYLLPHFLYTDPASVRSLLMYRWHLLDRARERAVQMQGTGALYSWNSITGEECGFVYEASTAEYHLQSAIAYGIWRYHTATGDDAFLHEHGVDILIETARFLHDRGCLIAGKGFCINTVCGPDEYACGVDNNCYTNLMAQWHLRYAATVLDDLRQRAPSVWQAVQQRLACGPAEAEAWRAAAEAMYIPYDAERRIHAQDDSYLWKDPADMRLVPKNTDIRERLHPLNLWRLQVSKQADVVLAMLVQGWQFDREQKRRNYAYYEPRTNHGSSLSPCIHSIIACEIGEMESAYDYFRHSVLMDLVDFKDNTSAGVHAACLGGNWLAVVQGFAGMRDWPDQELAFAPRCPAAWQGYRFAVVHRGDRIAVAVDPAGVSLSLAAQARPRSVLVYDRRVELQPGQTQRVELAAAAAPV